jgi:hypothetical protein
MDSPITTADLRPGSKFTAKPVTFVVMNDAMRRHRPGLVEILGARWVHSPDWLMVEAASSGHMLIMSEAGCDQDQLAVAIHEMSPRATRDLIRLELDQVPADRAAQVDIVKRASKQATTIGATVVLKLQPKPPPLDPTFLSLLYASAYGVRVIVLADCLDDARAALGEAIVALCQQVLLRPLAYRADEIEPLLDRRFVVRQAPHLRAADLLPENQEAVRRYTWPKNLAELRLVADILVAYETQGGWRGAEKVLGVPKTSLADRIDETGMKPCRVDTGAGDRRGTIRHSFFKPTSGNA